MRQIILTVTAVFIGLYAFAAKVDVQRPAQKHATSFAIVIDEATFAKCRNEVNAYRDALDRDNLAVYTIVAAWETPEQVKEQLTKLYNTNSRRMPLEGAVFIGDVPFASVQNAQHMTTAFKMNEQAFPITEASVTSDRFYDDMHLKFDFIKRDSLNSLRFYYRLAPDSPQRLNPTFYSGRILYPEQLGGDKYEAISRYLRKVVAERAKAESIQEVVTYAGNGYNSDCLTAWIDESVALKEMFPQLFRNDYAALTQLNFRMDEYMKYRLYDQIERDNVDVMLFNEHGSPDKQHISGLGNPDTFETRMEALRSDIYYALRSEKRKADGDVEGAVEYFKKEFNLTDKFFEEFFNPSQEKEVNQGDMTLDDIAAITPQPRFVMFNACYNGSFHQKGYVAGSYIFSDGRTVVAQGNTVNVLQDRWTYEMLGLLTHGVRVGQYNRMIATLEGHIIGDPAFHFASTDDNTLAEDLVTRRCDTPSKALNERNAAYWREMSETENADTQSAALRMLTDGNAITAQELLEKYRSCKFATTRMECLKLIMRHGYSPEAVTAVGEALYDSYEVVRRNAANYACMLGAVELLPKAADLIVNYPESQRVAYTLSRSMQLFPEKDVMAAFKAAADSSNYPEKKTLDEMSELLESMQKTKQKDMSQLFDASAAMARRISAIRSVRNYTYHEYVPQLIELMNDEQQPAELRTVVVEALGWFTLSPSKDQIIEACRALKTDDKALKEEAVQTINRLNQ